MIGLVPQAEREDGRFLVVLRRDVGDTPVDHVDDLLLLGTDSDGAVGQEQHGDVAPARGLRPDRQVDGVERGVERRVKVRRAVRLELPNHRDRAFLVPLRGPHEPPLAADLLGLVREGHDGESIGDGQRVHYRDCRLPRHVHAIVIVHAPRNVDDEDHVLRPRGRRDEPRPAPTVVIAAYLRMAGGDDAERSAGAPEVHLTTIALVIVDHVRLREAAVAHALDRARVDGIAVRSGGERGGYPYGSVGRAIQSVARRSASASASASVTGGARGMHQLVGRHASLVRVRRRAVVVVRFGTVGERRRVAAGGCEILHRVAEGEDVGLHAPEDGLHLILLLRARQPPLPLSSSLCRGQYCRRRQWDEARDSRHRCRRFFWGRFCTLVVFMCSS
mmetsp:Transcript_37615/g.90702  ORF Transcript_37615/g.90702 Transcript_37615/m.90702 type:complete len:389 (+) Transcript_37615:1178-2344(+)